MSDLLDRRLLFVTGKGGVGKTTVAASLALLAASRGKRTLVGEVDAKITCGSQGSLNSGLVRCSSIIALKRKYLLDFLFQLLVLKASIRV